MALLTVFLGHSSKEAGHSQVFEQKDGHQSAVEKVLGLAELRQRYQLVDGQVVVRVVLLADGVRAGTGPRLPDMLQLRSQLQQSGNGLQWL